MKKKIFSVLLSLMMCLMLIPTNVLAEEDEGSSKTLTVGAGETYTTVQQAINAIYAEEDPTGWTIEVESGTYKRFTVLSGMNGLTIRAVDGADVTISTWDGTESEDGSVPKRQESYYLYNGIYIMSGNVTLQGLTINVGWDVDVSYATTLRTGLTDFDLSYSSCWYVAGIRTTKADSADGLVIDDCKFTSSIQGDDSNTNYGILTACHNFTVKNTSFNGFWQGISVMGDYYAVSDVSISDNTFTNCNRAISIYYKAAPEDTDSMGTLSITNNIITGSSNVRSKIILHDVSSNGSMGNVIMSGNTFSYGAVLIVNFAESPDTINGKTVVSGEAKSSVFSNNTWMNGSFYVESSEYYNSESGYTGTITADYPELAYYEAPESDEGYWVLNVDLDSSPYTGSYANPEGTTQYVQSVIAEANEAGSHTLSFTFDDEDQLIYTLTAFKDSIYWVSGEMPTEKVSEPGLDKVIVTTDDEGNEVEVDQDEVAAGDDVSYKLTSNVPSNLDDYIDYSAAEGSTTTNVIPLGTVGTDDDNNAYTYTLTFHDVLDSTLIFNNDVAVTLVTYELDDNGNVTTTVKGTIDVTDYANVTVSTDDAALADGCTFEVSIDLLKLYADGKIVEADFGSALIVVTYTATLSENATAGAYYNTAWVVYPDEESEEDKVRVDTYDLSIYKYDQSVSDGVTYTKGLPGAEFRLLQIVENAEDADDTVEIDGVECNVAVVKTVTSGENGIATISGLDAGTYYLQETEAPTGYVASGTVLEVEVSAENANNYVVTVQFANAPVPSTGGMGTALFTIVGMCLLLAAGAVYVFTRRRFRNA